MSEEKKGRETEEKQSGKVDLLDDVVLQVSLLEFFSLFSSRALQSPFLRGEDKSSMGSGGGGGGGGGGGLTMLFEERKKMRCVQVTGS